MKEIRTEIVIEASVDRVWQILTDFPGYVEWNPFIVDATGELKVSSRLEVQIRPPGGKPTRFRPRVTRVQPNQELRWLGHLWIPGLFNGEHCFLLVRLAPGRTQFVQRESFTGVLVPFFANWLETTVRPGFDAMNRALKARAERNGQS